MSWNKRDFLETMEAGKRRAQHARNRGQTITGKAAKGWVRGTRRHDDGGPANEDIASSYGLLAVALAIEDHMREIYPQRYEVFT